MHYQYAVKIPADTGKSDGFRRPLRLVPGQIEKVDISFPAGCVGLVGVRILRGHLQLWPLSPDQWIVSDNFTVTFPGTYELDERPFELTFEGYNLDETYDHTIRIGITLDEKKIELDEVLEYLTEGIPATVAPLVEGEQVIAERIVEIGSILRDEVTPVLEEIRNQEAARVKREVGEMSIEELTRI